MSDHATRAMRKVRKLLLPAWYLPNGTMYASDDQLDGASSSCERCAIWCGVLVIVAVVAETVGSFANPSYGLFLQFTAFSDAAVAIGITGEILLGTMWNNRIQTELRARSNMQLASAVQSAGEANVRAGEANQKAKEAALELMKYRQLRGLTPEARGRVVEKIWRLGPQKFDASVNPGDPEYIQCLRSIELALQEAGWEQQDWKGGGPVYDRSSYGLPIIGNNGSVRNVAIFFKLVDSANKYAKPATALADALSAEGIIAYARVVLADTVPLTGPPIHITVGPKT